jgi:hypothetical protein
MNRSCRQMLTSNGGSVLALTFIALLLLSALALSLGSISLVNWESESRDNAADLAAYVARAGLERSCSDVLLPSSDWSLLLAGPLYTAEPFAAGDFSVQLVVSTTNAATLRIDASATEGRASLEFQMQRLTSAGGGSGATTGVKILVVRDLVLETTFG